MKTSPAATGLLFVRDGVGVAYGRVRRARVPIAEAAACWSITTTGSATSADRARQRAVRA
ncbi:MAG: hypothetical protein R2713_18570 [Ilumatobacteraceae bacterium]